MLLKNPQGSLIFPVGIGESLFRHRHVAQNFVAPCYVLARLTWLGQGDRLRGVAMRLAGIAEYQPISGQFRFQADVVAPPEPYVGLKDLLRPVQVFQRALRLTQADIVMRQVEVGIRFRLSIAILTRDLGALRVQPKSCFEILQFPVNPPEGVGISRQPEPLTVFLPASIPPANRGFLARAGPD